MDKQTQSNDNHKELLSKLAILLVFLVCLGVLIARVYDAEPDVKKVTMQQLARQFQQSVTNAHWQWQGEGRPNMLMLVHYDNSLDDESRLVEKGRSPVAMGQSGWPAVEPNDQSCKKLWSSMLNLPADVRGFKVFTEYYAGDKAQQVLGKCRYRISIGWYFDYKIGSGEVSKLQR